MKIGERMKICRKSWGFTQTQVAEYLGVQQGQIAKLENGTRTLKQDAIDKLILLFGVNKEWFVDGVGESGLNTVRFCGSVELETMAKWNKIINNIKFLSEITEGLE